MKISPLAPKLTAQLPALPGVRMATAQAGIKYQDRKDLLLMIFDQPWSVAGVFTKSKCASAPVDWCRAGLAKNNPQARAVVINAGNANAFTGKKGEEATMLTAQAASKACGCDMDEVYLASTGVIGEPLDASKFSNRLEELAQVATSDHWQQAAEAIMTTDTYPKLATREFEVNGATYRINGIAKGSGMIAPDMATMLSFVVTDLPVAQPLLQSVLSELVDDSFNAVTVDSDTSTSDTLMLFAPADQPILQHADDAGFPAFKAALADVFRDLSLQIVAVGHKFNPRHVDGRSLALAKLAGLVYQARQFERMFHAPGDTQHCYGKTHRH